MDLRCETCGRTFPTNASLYMHKQTHNPSLVLLNHNHDQDGNSGGKPDPELNPELEIIDDYKFVPGTRKRYRDSSPEDSRIPTPSRKKKPNSQQDPGLEIIDEYPKPNVPGTRKRYHDSIPEDFRIPMSSRKKKPNSQLDSGLEIIDEYPKPDGGGLDDDFQIVDEYIDDNYGDEQLDDGLEIVDSYVDKKLDYKAMYERCIKDSKGLKYKFKKHLEKVNRRCKTEIARRVKEAFEEYSNEIRGLHRKHQSEIEQLKKFHEKQMADLESLKDRQCNDKLADMHKQCQIEIDKIKDRHQKELAELEDDCTERLKVLNDQIRSMQEDDENLSGLTKAIFNCTTMEEIFEIQRLIKNHRIDLVVQNHLKTLQNLFLSLSYGVLPICQPQRDRVTDSQRRLVEQIQTSSRPTARRLMNENRNDVVNLFTIINDSLKLARNSYNRYGAATVNRGV